MTLQASPPAAPSWRVLVALRLLHHRLSAGTSSSLSASTLAPWYDVVSGVTEVVSSANEAKVRASWSAIAQSMLHDAEAGLAACDRLRSSWLREDKSKVGDSDAAANVTTDASDAGTSDLLASLEMVRTVWTEQARISRVVLADTAQKP